MALIVICGQPSSGKSLAATCLAEALKESEAKETVRIIDEASFHLDRNQSYASMPAEKNLRGVLRSEVDRSVSKDNIIIVDSLNSIKGYRYELWCLARAAGIRYCVLYCDLEEDHCRKWNKERREKGEAAYDDKIFEDLVRRFEKPDRRNRWDSPLPGPDASQIEFLKLKLARIIMASDDFDGDDKAEWSSRNEGIFIRILHKHVKMGELDSKTTFIKRHWCVIDDELFAETNKRYTIPKLKSKFNRLRKKYREFSDLIKHPGFDWNPVSNTITAPDSVWAAYVKSVPGVKPYRKKGLENYHILGEIFSGNTATSQMHLSLSQLSPTSDDERELSENLIKSRVHVDAPKDDDLMDVAVECRKEKRVRRSLDQTSEHIPKLWDKLEHYLEICTKVVSQKLEKIKEKSCEPSLKTEIYSIQQCIDAAEAMGDVDNDTFNKLMEKIVDLEWRKIFLSMTDDRKRAWLASL